MGTAATETVTGRNSVTRMVGANFNNAAHKFAVVTVESGGGSDIATLHDSPGDDWFTGNPAEATLSGPDYSITTRNYVRVNAYATTGNDRAVLNGSSGDDVYTGRPELGSLQTPTSQLFVSRFDSVTAYGGATDLANIYDSAGDDHATVSYRAAELTGINFHHSVTEFGRVQLYATQGNDTAFLSDSSGNDRFQGSNTAGTWVSTGFVAAFQRFDTITLSDSNGGTNDVVVSSLAYELIIGLGWRRR